MVEQIFIIIRIFSTCRLQCFYLLDLYWLFFYIVGKSNRSYILGLHQFHLDLDGILMNHVNNDFEKIISYYELT
jgi:hypothetical protein